MYNIYYISYSAKFWWGELGKFGELNCHLLIFYPAKPRKNFDLVVSKTYIATFGIALLKFFQLMQKKPDLSVPVIRVTVINVNQTFNW